METPSTQLELSEQITKTCCICLENIQDYITCNDCEEGIYCKKCLQKITNNDNIYKCSICRREYSNNLLTPNTINGVEHISICLNLENITIEIYNYTLEVLKILIFIIIAISLISLIIYMLT